MKTRKYLFLQLAFAKWQLLWSTLKSMSVTVIRSTKGLDAEQSVDTALPFENDFVCLLETSPMFFKLSPCSTSLYSTSSCRHWIIDSGCTLHASHIPQLELFPISTWVQTPLHPLLEAVMSDWIYACLMGPLSHVLWGTYYTCPISNTSHSLCLRCLNSAQMSVLMSHLHNWWETLMLVLSVLAPLEMVYMHFRLHSASWQNHPKQTTSCTRHFTATVARPLGTCERVRH